MITKVTQYKGFKIHKENDNYIIYTKEEWSYGKGIRQPEWDTNSESEAKSFIDAYNTL
ncbi:hypothetical protein [Paenibacillus sp. 1781tsa1]|uniref:hypothetical protein n=1 Tax=Paenibacillus sp. 1781tsa1 TaxID=2953810 RepID=UPI0020A1FEA0|nr:hypothetical protein [Paenibacillus sp. 1781tsa1]MCP1185055.1 hypothetical protein [Paenibacillus sp. 1781tsa1]